MINGIIPFQDLERRLIDLGMMDEVSLQHGLMIQADTEFDIWTFDHLDFSDLMNIVLPWHVHIDDPPSDQDMISSYDGVIQFYDRLPKNKILVPKTGMTVEQALQHYSTLTDYGSFCPACDKKIRQLAKIPLGPLVLTESPLKGDISYQGINQALFSPDALFHLDGLHRLMSISYRNVDTIGPVLCYVARNLGSS